MIVLAISVDSGGEKNVRKLVKNYVRDRNLTFINLLDPNASVADEYRVNGVPMTFFINPKGRIVAYAKGYRAWDSEKGLKMIEQFLTE